MAFEILVHVLDHRGQSRGLATTGGPGQQDDAAGRFGQLAANGRQTELVEGGHLALDVAQGHGPLATLLEDVGAETPNAMHVVRKVGFALLFQAGFPMARHDVAQHLLDPLVRRMRRIDGQQLAVDADRHRMRHFQMDVGGMTLNGRMQNLMKNFHVAQITQPHWKQLGRFGPQDTIHEKTRG